LPGAYLINKRKQARKGEFLFKQYIGNREKMLSVRQIGKTLRDSKLRRKRAS
jgi:hypothetical protein